MNLSSEQVHWIGGVAFCAVALLLLIRQLQNSTGAWWDALLPLLFIGYGLESFVDLWVHGSAVPADYARESRQHLWQGGALLVAGIIQGLAARGTLRHWAWQLATPFGLAVLAVGFAVHAQHGTSEIGMLLMSTQHRAFAIALGLAAAARTVSLLPLRNARTLEAAWLVALLNFGLLMLSYRESAPVMTHD